MVHLTMHLPLPSGPPSPPPPLLPSPPTPLMSYSPHRRPHLSQEGRDHLVHHGGKVVLHVLHLVLACSTRAGGGLLACVRFGVLPAGGRYPMYTPYPALGESQGNQIGLVTVMSRSDESILVADPGQQIQVSRSAMDGSITSRSRYRSATDG